MSLDQFIRLADNMVEFEADLNDSQYPITSIHALEVHRNELKSNWVRVKEAYEKFLMEAEKEGDDTERPFELESIKVKYKSTYITYCGSLVKLSEIADALRTSPNANSTTSARHEGNNHSPSSSKKLDLCSLSHSDSNKLNLPPIDIETFRGDYASWPTFRDIFSAVVSNSRASNVEKLFYLIKKTAGEAKEIVQKSPLTNEGFNIAWENLCSRYENRRVLVNGQLRILFGLQNISSESSEAIKQLQREINSCISILRLYEIDINSWDPIFVFICTGSLPESTLILWEQQLKDKTTIPKWADLDSFLTNRYRTLESVSEIRSNGVKTKPKNATGPSSATNSHKPVKSFQVKVFGPLCQLCPRENHTIRKCPKFLKMDHQRRLDEVKRQGLCLNCFSKTHSV